jgi:hypothetical protein
VFAEAHKHFQKGAGEGDDSYNFLVLKRGQGGPKFCRKDITLIFQKKGGGLDLPMICTVALLTVKRNFFFQIIELYN